MSATVHRQLVRSQGLHWQYRQAGQERGGLPWVLLHPSPRSSAMYEPWMRELGQHMPVLAIDLPGYGGSDPLSAPPTQMSDYAGPLHELLLQIAGPRCRVYGSATGAQLGIALALAHPEQVAHLVIDNAAHFDDAEREAIIEQYFPDQSPRADGSHLLAAWRQSAQMQEFFPWFAADEAHRIAPAPPTAEATQAALREMLAAGPGWSLAYRAAFEHERAEHVQALRVPTTLLRWEGSILLRHIDRLIAHPLPPSLKVLPIPAPPAERLRAMSQHLIALHDSGTN